LPSSGSICSDLQARKVIFKEAIVSEPSWIGAFRS
jgi:hypothetical protein